MSVFSNAAFYPDIRISADSLGNLYIGKSDSLIIRKYSEHGELSAVLRDTYSPAPLTDNHIDSLYNHRGNLFKKAVNEVGRPDYWPTFQDFLIDDLGRCWVELIDPGKSDQTWWIFSRENQPQWKLKLPVNVTLFEVQKEQAYGIFRAEDSISKVIRFQIKGLEGL
ncbi:hypothetical protein SAMN05443144_10110 [Fodinibius roseus]|uniref:Uncharacterized protein n=1 Tax=Fodinibius roseus TaxID=1194090 RepID=A0A1M4SE40_9BACT|nr:hypothetical protein [Fodinibius roseus]SHE30438.1 hypothetical protein SAMN05443144_10110 [Fodinibius roseus]